MTRENKAVVEAIPYSIGQDILDRLQRYDRDDFAADYAIGNQPWLSAANDERPITRGTTQYQKERVDQESSAGENTLSNWWMRSATSWHHGGGELFYDGEDSDKFRFRESANVDVWTTGVATLLPATDRVDETAGDIVLGCAKGVWVKNDSGVFLYDAETGEMQDTLVSETVYSMATDGKDLFVGYSGGIKHVDDDLVVTTLYNAPGGSWEPQAIGFVKDRLIVAAVITDALPYRVFELSAAPESADIDLDPETGDSRYESAGVQIEWVSVAETSRAILVGMVTGARSRVLSFTIDDTASGNAGMQVPVIVAEYPIGERLHQVRTYLNTYVISSTSRGLRVGLEKQDGTGYLYGPLTIESEVKDMAFDGSYVYATRSELRAGSYGLWRVDLGNRLDDERYAYASDLSSNGVAVNAVANVGLDGLMCVLGDDGLFVESATEKAENGYINSGWVRWGTTERKQPVSLTLHSAGEGGFFSVELATQEVENVFRVGYLGIGDTRDIPVSTALTPTSELEIRVNFFRDESDATLAPILEEWQVRALPAPVRSRTLTIPMLCFTEEADSNGVVRTSDPYRRLKELEKTEQDGGSVLFQDFSTGEERICVVGAVQFEQTTPPSFKQGFGGIVTVQLQTVDAEVI